MTNSNIPTDEDIGRYAYYLWEAEGRQQGRDLDYWLQAKAQLSSAQNRSTAEVSLNNHDDKPTTSQKTVLKRNTRSGKNAKTAEPAAEPRINRRSPTRTPGNDSRQAAIR